MTVNAWLRDDPPDLEHEDAFGVKPLVERLTELVRTAPYPFTIALSGSWGAGKTTVTRQVFRDLDKISVPVCFVDLWVESIDQLRRTLVIEVAAALRQGATSAVIKTRIADELDAQLRSSRTTVLPPRAEFKPSRLWKAARANKLRAVAIAAAMFDVLAVVQFAFPVLMPSVATLIGALLTFLALNSGLFVTVTNTSQSQAPAHSFVATQEKFRELVSAGSGPVLVVVDNIDRLTAEDALTALREIRSLIEIQGSRCVFVIPIDRTALVTQLRRQLGGGRAARDFLDKFFNVDIPLTDPEVVDLRDWVRRLATKMFSGVGSEEISELAQVVVLGCGRSPRAAKRILNGVYARDRLVDAELRKQLTLQKLAVIESLLVRFPNSLRVLLDQPRRFTDLRRRDGPLADGSPEAVLAREVAGAEVVTQLELIRLMQGTREVELTPSDIRAVLSLREEREWRGVGDAAVVAQSLEAGDGPSLMTILEQLPSESRPEAVSRWVEWIRKSAADGYRTFAFNGLNAAAAAVDPASADASRLRAVGLEMLKGDDFNDAVGRLSDSAVALLFAAEDRQPEKLQAWRRATEAVSVETPETTLNGCVRLIRSGARFASDSQLATIQSRLANFGHAALEPLFEDPTEPRLIAGDLGNRYATDLATLELVAGNVDSYLVAAQRLRIARGNGWSDGPLITPLAQRLAVQLPLVSEIGDQAIQLIDDLTAVTGDFVGGGVSALMTGLIGWAGAQRALTIAFALRHNPKDLTPAAKQQVEAWLTAADNDSVRLFAERSAGARSLPTVDPARILANRWLAGQDPTIAELSLQFELESQKASAMLAALDAAPVAIALEKFAEAITVASGASRNRVPELVTSLMRLIQEAPVTATAKLIEIMDKLEQASGSADLASLAEAFKKRVAGSSKAELESLASLGESVARRLPTQSPAIVHSYVEHAAVSAYVPLAALPWLRSADRPDVDVVVGVVGGSIRRGEYSTEELVPALVASRTALRYDSSIRAALGVFAAKRTGDCGEAEVLLVEAREWKPCAGQELDELDAALTTVGNACANCADAIAALRAVRRDRQENE